MNDLTSTQADPRPLEPVHLRGAAWLGALLLGILALLIALLAHDGARRAELETTTQTTAVGDTNYLKHRTRGAAPEVTLNGRLLVPPSPRHIELRDTKMVQAGEVDGGAYRLYTTSEPVPWEKGEVEDKNRPVYYLKTGLGEYLRVQ